MKALLILMLSMTLVSCGAIVSTDYDQEVDFSRYKTYNFYPTIESGLNELDDKRIMYVTDSLLQARGLTKSNTPDLFINFFAQETLNDSRNTIGIGFGGVGRNVGGSVSGGIPIGSTQINQVLTMDFIDVMRDDLVWQAVSDGNYREKATPEKKEAYYRAVIQKILKQYPPKK